MRQYESWVDASKNVMASIVEELDADCPDRKTVWQLVLDLRDQIDETGRGAPVPVSILLDCRDPEMESGSEQAFRRGYVHGYVHAIDDENKTKHQRNSHVETLMKWRYGDCSKIIDAPVIKKRKNGGS